MEEPVCVARAQTGVESEITANMDAAEPSQLTCCRVLEIGTEIESLETIWRMLYADSESPTAFATWEWVSAWWRHFSCANPGQSLTLFPVAIYDSTERSTERLIGLAPFYFSMSSNGTLQRRALRLLGDLGPEPALSEELPLLLRRGSEPKAVSFLLAYLNGPARNQWDTLHLSVRVPESVEGERARELSVAGSRAFNTSTVLDTEWLKLPDHWEVLRKSLSKSTRDNLAYYPRLLNRHDRTWSIRRVNEPDVITHASDVVVDLHRRRARCTVGVPHLDHLPMEIHQDCLREAFHSLAQKGRASIWLLEIDGQAAAAQAVFECDANICIYYSGFEPSFRAYSPLTILHSEIIKTAIVEKKSGVNFLGGQFHYKSRWGARSIPRSLQIRKVRPSPISVIRTLIDFASRK